MDEQGNFDLLDTITFFNTSLNLANYNRLSTHEKDDMLRRVLEDARYNEIIKKLDEIKAELESIRHG